MSDVTFTSPGLTTVCRLDELGLVVVGQHLEPDHAVLACRVADPVRRITTPRGGAWRLSDLRPSGWLRCCVQVLALGPVPGVPDNAFTSALLRAEVGSYLSRTVLDDAVDTPPGYGRPTGSVTAACGCTLWAAS